jgi:hypothetical protein
MTASPKTPSGISPRLLEGAIFAGGLVTGFLTPPVIDLFDRLGRFRFSTDLSFVAGGVPFALLIMIIARSVASVGGVRTSALGVMTLIAAYASLTLTARTSLALGTIAEPLHSLLCGPVGGLIGSGLMTLAAVLLRIGPRHPVRWWAFVLVGTALGALLVIDLKLKSDEIWVLFPVWQASVALVFLRTVQNARRQTREGQGSQDRTPPEAGP